MARYSTAAICVFAALLMSGCQSLPGTTAVTYTVGQELPELTTVKTPAKFALYAGESDKPIWSDQLGVGDEYGFVKRADGLVYGVARGQDIPLPASKATAYFWRREDQRSVADE